MIARSLPELGWLRYVALEARQIALKESWAGTPPQSLLKLVGARERRLVESESQLSQVTLDLLNDYQKELQGEGRAVEDLWNEMPRTPKKEEWISNHIARHLRREFARRGVVVNREVEIRAGEKTDIHVDAVRRLPGDEADQVRVIIEVKGCWNERLKKDMREQLRDRYLRENQCSHGIYLVAWFLCDSWAEERRKKHTPKWEVERVTRFFEQQALQLSTPDELLRSFVLNATLR
jgi:hypothetical protein